MVTLHFPPIYHKLEIINWEPRRLYPIRKIENAHSMANIWRYKDITYSLFEVVKFLLENGASFLFTEKFNQDRLEEYFGKHRILGRRNDNTDVY